jgi:hypothetical protein
MGDMRAKAIPVRILGADGGDFGLKAGEGWLLQLQAGEKRPRGARGSIKSLFGASPS